MLFINVLFSILTIDITYIGTTITIDGSSILSQDDITQKNIPITSITTVTVGEGITGLADSTFEGFTKLSQISLPTSLQTIGSRTFASTALETLHIPIGLTSINSMSYLFYLCKKLSSITVDQSNPVYSSFDSCLYSRDFSQILCVPYAKTSISFHSSVREFGSWSFYANQIDTISVPNSVTVLNKMTFVDNFELKQLIFSSNSQIQTFPNMFFYNGGLDNFTCPPLVTSLEASSFHNLQLEYFFSLEDGNLAKINGGSFQNCRKLRLVVLPQTIEYISSEAFAGCSSLEEIRILGNSIHYTAKNGAIFTADESTLIFIPPSIYSIEIPANTSVISTSSLQKCANAEVLVVNESNSVFNEYKGILYTGSYSNALHSIGGIKTAYIKEDTITLSASLFESHPKLESVVFEGSSKLKSIGNNCFAYINTLAQIELPLTVETLGINVFRESSIKTFCIPPLVEEIMDYCFSSSWIDNFTFHPDSQLKKIGISAFQVCYNLTTAQLPEGLLTIGIKAFFWATKLSSINFPDSIETVLDNAFYNTAIQNVEFSANSNLASLGDIVFGACSMLTSFAVPPKLKTIGKTCFNNCKKLAAILFPGESSLQSIGENAFSYTIITEIDIPDSVQVISSSAFRNCNSFTTFRTVDNTRYSSYEGVLYDSAKETLEIFPPGLTSCLIYEGCSVIAPNAFLGALKLESVLFKSNSVLNEIGDNTFEGCVLLNSITIPRSVSSVGSSVLKDCSNLQSFSVEADSNLQSIGSALFSGCTNLEILKFEGLCPLTSFGSALFESLTKLRTAILPSGLNTIDHSLFSGCNSLSSIVIPDSVTRIESCSFKGCSALTNITLPSMLDSINEDSFSGCTKISVVIFCGFNQFTDPIFASSYMEISAFTLTTYPFRTLFGIDCNRVMHKCNLFPTEMFSANTENDVSLLFLLAGALSMSDEE